MPTARPASDYQVGSWVNETTATTNLYASIDEVTAVDTDYIQSSTGTSGVPYITFLSIVQAPFQNATHTIRFRAAATTTGTTGVLQVRLLDGTTGIATWTHAAIGTSFVTFEHDLTTTQVASLTVNTTGFYDRLYAETDYI